MLQPGPLLARIDSPADLRGLAPDELAQLRDELREYIVDCVSQYGGHFGASLGVVELTIAIHKVFNTPEDQLVWDVGHQAYGHKILTGRRDNFATNRVYGGLSGFPKRSESPYDTFGVGHSSTSISAALGMAAADKIKGGDRQHIAVIGDGAMGAGMAFEAMNHAGVADTNLLIVLNDNNMSIDPNVGALKDYLLDVTTSRTYNKIKREAWKILGKTAGKGVREQLAKLDRAFKTLMLKHSNLFESLQIRYFGPVDGHDLDHLVTVMEDLKRIPGPKLLHVLTKKGKGYEPAELEQTKWHATSGFDKITGQALKKAIETPQPPKYQDVFGHTMVELAKADERIVGITPAMPSGSSLNIMMREMPERAFDVGIAEQHAVTFSAGLATAGLKPFCNVYSSFMQRGYDQLIHDVALQKLPVVFCLDRAGLVGADGPTHHGAYDLAFLRPIPELVVAAPMDEHELRHLMLTASKHEGPFAIRYPRGNGVHVDWRVPMKELPIGQGRLVSEGRDVAILTLGAIGNEAQKAIEALRAEGLEPAHYDLRYLKPLDGDLMKSVAENFSRLITVEDGCVEGGFGSAVLEWLSVNNYGHIGVERLGIPDRYIEHGTQAQLWAECGYDAQGIAQAARRVAATAPVR